MTVPTNHLVLYNPAAGRGKAGRSPKAVSDALIGAGIDHTVYITEAPGHALELLRRHGEDVEGVIVVGGDGSLHEVIQGLDLERHKLAIVPWGTGNDFAWMHNWTPDPEACALRIAANGERHIDLGSWTARLLDGETRSGRLHNSVGLGFEAVVNYESHRITAVKGPALYLVALLRTLRRFRCYPLRLEWDQGELEEQTALVCLANGKRVGGAFYLAPHAKTNDGKFDLVLVGKIGWASLLALLPRTLRGTHMQSSRVSTYAFSKLTARAADGIPGYVDGEFVDMKIAELTVEVMPGALRTW